MRNSTTFFRCWFVFAKLEKIGRCCSFRWKNSGFLSLVLLYLLSLFSSFAFFDTKWVFWLLAAPSDVGSNCKHSWSRECTFVGCGGGSLRWTEDKGDDFWSRSKQFKICCFRSWSKMLYFKIKYLLLNVEPIYFANIFQTVLSSK